MSDVTGTAGGSEYWYSVTYSTASTDPSVTNNSTWTSEPYNSGDYITYRPTYLGIVRDYVPKSKPKLDPWMVMDEGL